MKQKEEFLSHFLANEKGIRSFINSLVRDWDARNDVLQDVAVVLWEKFDEYDRLRPFGTWARGIASKKILQRFQKGSNAPVPLSSQVIDAVCEAFDRRPPEGPAEAEALQRCVERLPLKSRQLLGLRYGFGTAEPMKTVRIAAQLGVNADAVHQALSRIRTRLRECIQGWTSDQRRHA